MGNFDYFKDYPPFSKFADAAIDAEGVFNTSLPLCAMSCRRALEVAVKWVYDNDSSLTNTGQTLSGLIHEVRFKEICDYTLFKKITYLTRIGNDNAHNIVQITRVETLELLHILFLFYKWVDSRYRKDHDNCIQFDPSKIPNSKMDSENISRLVALNEQKDSVINELTKKNKELNDKYYEERTRNLKDRKYDPMELTESDTRKLYIDTDLIDSGWKLSGPYANVIKEFKLEDMGGIKGEIGFADYVLFGKDGIPLAVVEAKKTSIESNAGRAQVCHYADALERRYKRRPMMFMTNGFDTVFWDDVTAPERVVSGIFSQEDLQRLIDRRTVHSDPATIPIDDRITDRYYQKEAIRAVCHDINEGIRKHLIVMATGTGKTRTASSLVDVLSKSGILTNVLFLADRNVLVDQAQEDFKKYLPYMSTSNLCDEKPDFNARILFSTYQTIMNRIDEAKDGSGCKVLTPAHFDLIIIDESHRSIFKKFRAIFDYFDSMILGLTATPKTEVERNTYDFFDKSEGIPTYAYDYETAVYVDHYLVPYYNYEVKTKILDEGISYKDLSDGDKERYEQDFYDDGRIPEAVESDKINKFVFNEKTIDLVIQDLMERGIKIDGGDHVGKSIIFATNRNHANLIKQRFDALYPQYKGIFATVVVHDNDEKFNKDVIWKFKNGHGMDPQIVISVDMMDTGVDVRDCVNLVFFKKVHSIVKFWQMIGRGTRLYPEGMFSDRIDGNYTGKKRFLIFDYCGNFEFFRQNINGYESCNTRTVSQNIFEKCIRIIYELQKSEYADDEYQAFRQSLVELCHNQIMLLNTELMSVHLRRRYVDKFKNIESFQCISESDLNELISEIAPLVVYESVNEYSKYFDSLMYSLILATLTDAPYSAMQVSLTDIANRLKSKVSIPQVRNKLSVIETVLSDEFWTDADPLSFEMVRIDLRELMQFLERETIKPIITSITDTAIQSEEGRPTTFGYDFEDYRVKVNRYVNAHKDEGPIFKINHNLPLDTDDVAELMRIFTQELGTPGDYSETYGDMDLGVMIRKMVKLDHNSTMDAFSRFINDSSLNQQQIQFVHKLIQYVENEGIMDVSDLMKSPFDKPANMMRLFNSKEATDIVNIINEINENAKTHLDIASMDG